LPAARERDVHGVAVDVEVAVGLPDGEAGMLDRALAETAEHQEPLRDGPLQTREIDLLAEGHDPADHHQVVRAVHPQPCGVDRGNLVAPERNGHGG